MVTISLCMIVKNEERILKRCLDSVADIVDEIIIVDTGSTDSTKSIAAQYTDKIYDFEWIDDFSAARNYSFSKATMEYIYTADADEVINEENRQKFIQLKSVMDGEIEIVQMKYANQLSNGTVYNFDEEFRPKLFKRLRSFTWIEAIHETIRTKPVVFDSDIVITHLPENNHADRDLKNFEKQIREGRELSERLFDMYARECYLNGEGEHLAFAVDYFKKCISNMELSKDSFMQGCSIIAKSARINNKMNDLLKYVVKVMADEGCSEMCYELGLYFEGILDYEEACIWFYNAVYETKPVMSLRASREDSLLGLIRCYKALDMPEVAEQYSMELENLDS